MAIPLKEVERLQNESQELNVLERMEKEGRIHITRLVELEEE